MRTIAMFITLVACVTITFAQTASSEKKIPGNAREIKYEVDKNGKRIIDAPKVNNNTQSLQPKTSSTAKRKATTSKKRRSRR